MEIGNLIYEKEMPANCLYPIQPLLYFTNIALNQPSMPFDKILNCLIAVLKSLLKQNEDSELVDDLVGKIIAKTSFESLHVKELALLVQVLKLCRKADDSWLERFLENVPHSTHDETFVVLEELLTKCSGWLKSPLLDKVVNTLLDQYTVKGKAHKRTKELLTELLCKSGGVEAFLELCLVNNPEPTASAREINQRKVRQFDSKLFAKSC